jgi:pyrroline-5-carboxylate reductase
MDAAALPILLVGAGRMGGALIAGWRLSGAAAPSDLLLLDPAPGEEARVAAAAGARLNPPMGALSSASTVVIAVKPQVWRESVATVASHLAPAATVISIVAGVASDDLSRALGGRQVTRAMPTTAAEVGKAAVSVWAPDEAGRRRAHSLFEPLGSVVDLEDEDQLHAATAAAGSAPAYLYAFIEALESAAEAGGLPRQAASRLARSAIVGAAALLERTDADPADLRRQVTSPGGTTEAALAVLTGPGGLGPLLEGAVAAAVARSRVLGR